MHEEQTELLAKVNRLTIPVRVFATGSGMILVGAGGDVVLPKTEWDPVARTRPRAPSLKDWNAAHGSPSTRLSSAMRFEFAGVLAAPRDSNPDSLLQRQVS